MRLRRLARYRHQRILQGSRILSQCLPSVKVWNGLSIRCPGEGVQAVRGVCGQPLEERLERGLRRRQLASRAAELGRHASADQGGERTMASSNDGNGIAMAMAKAMAIATAMAKQIQGISKNHAKAHFCNICNKDFSLLFSEKMSEPDFCLSC